MAIAASTSEQQEDDDGRQSGCLLDYRPRPGHLEQAVAVDSEEAGELALEQVADDGDGPDADQPEDAEGRRARRCASPT